MESRNPNNGGILSRSETGNPYPTTFVQADTSNFKQVVQMLTGSAQRRTDPAPRREEGFKLYERRKSSKKGLMINPLASGASLPSVLSPSMLNFPQLMLSPVTPLPESGEDGFNRSASSSPEEAKAMAEKGFYLHPSPVKEVEPRLLPLFPVSSPRSNDSGT